MKKEFEVIQWEGNLGGNLRIYEDVEKLRKHLDKCGELFGNDFKIVTVSGGFDPIHIGHVRYIQSAAKLKGDRGALVVIANKDSWLERKKGFAFMRESERMEILSAIEGVDFVIPWDDGRKDVSGCLEILRPDIFANGGDRDSIENVPEYDICKELKCKMYFGVGGNKIQSSSELVENSKKEKNET